MSVLGSLWANGRPTVGLWHRLGTAQAAGIAARAGFDWVCVDAQHGFIAESEVRVMLGELARAECPSIVRTPWHDPGFAMRALDAGAHAILFPTINDADQADRVIKACKYPPVGYRSWAALGVGSESPAAANDATCCGVMIETADAVAAIDEILSVEGIDFVFVGPDDLAISLGCEPTTEPTDATVLEAIEHVRLRCADRGVRAGIYCGSDEMVRRWGSAGFVILARTSDTALLAEAAAAAARSSRLALDDWDPASTR
jgi:4-hydroxy-2-oxoheptanedioate aldolase